MLLRNATVCFTGEVQGEHLGSSDAISRKGWGGAELDVAVLQIGVYVISCVTHLQSFPVILDRMVRQRKSDLSVGLVIILEG